MLSLNGVVYLAPLFLFGMLLREESSLLEKRQIRVGIWFVSVGLLLQQAAPLLGATDVPRTSLAAALCGCAAAYVLFATCPRFALFETIGAYSYTIYLWHSIASASARETLERYAHLPTGIEFTLLLAIGIVVPILLHLVVRHIPVLATLMTGLKATNLPAGRAAMPTLSARSRVGVGHANDNRARSGTSRHNQVTTR
jgi:peptidoglycan/LPS O-acetylase OafA/YrhL